MEELSVHTQRMYFFVPYNISPIQQAIQSGHAALEYANDYGHTPEYRQFIENDKTWIILNGGTTNSTRERGTGVAIGTLNQISDTLSDYDIPHATFVEPDLNNALTAVCFLVDERVWTWKDYPEYTQWANDEYGELTTRYDDDNSSVSYRKTPTGQIDEDDVKQEYQNLVGGKENVILKELIYKKKIA